MSDPVSGTTVAAGGLMGASVFGLATGIDYGVVFGAFAGVTLAPLVHHVDDGNKGLSKFSQ